MIITLTRALLAKFGLIRRPDLCARVQEDHPRAEALSPGALVVVRAGPRDKWACFRCPGGCGEKIQLSLALERRPRWSVTLDWLRRPTVHPSVRVQNGCECHFWVRQGRVDWCADSGHARRRSG